MSLRFGVVVSLTWCLSSWCPVVSALEQNLACQDDHSSQYRQLVEKLAGQALTAADKLRLAILYALRYETSGNMARLKEQMTEGGCSASQARLVDQVLQYAGEVGSIDLCLGKALVFDVVAV